MLELSEMFATLIHLSDLDAGRVIHRTPGSEATAGDAFLAPNPKRASVAYMEIAVKNMAKT